MTELEIVDSYGVTQRVPVPAQGAGFSGDDRAQVGALARSEAGRTAGAVAAGNLMTSFLGDGATSAGTQEKAAEVITALGETLQSTEYAPEPIGPVQTTESGLAVVQAPEPATDYALPDDLSWLNDDDEDIDDEPVNIVTGQPAEPEFDDAELEADPRIAKLLAERKQAEKKAEQEKKLRLKSSRPQWEAEAERVFQINGIKLLSEQDIKGIRAESHRDFLKQAKAKADERKQWLEQSGALVNRQPAPEIVQREKQEQWGPPPAGVPPASSSDNNLETRLAKARRSGKLSNSIKEMIRGE